jgi:uncharacterized protein YdhG (YjbR/CyaY superfamily)
MKPATRTPANIDEYIAGFPREVQKKLQEVRATIQKAAPQAEEKISYKIAGFSLNGRNLIHFAGHTSHIGIYPVPRNVDAFKQALAPYAGGKGTARFPYDQPLPVGLITRIVRFRVKENETRSKTKPKKK